MRTDIVHPGAGELKYEIRAIVARAKEVEARGTPITWENIGDPVAKGEHPPEWLRDIVASAAREGATFAYSPTQGLDATREYIARERNLEGGIQITKNDILFYNGLGDSIAHLYGNLHPKARVIGPDPSYPTHSSHEAAHANAPHITYALDPTRGWEPDLVDLEAKLNAHPDIAGIVIINPDNPTGFVYPPETLRAIVALAKKYNLFIISDEIYSNLAYPDSRMQKLASVIGDVPGLALRGISKEFPWPGARCGWVEFYNRDKDENFNRYAQSLIEAKMLEVCSTTLPQYVIPTVMSAPRYYPYLAERIARYDERSRYAHQELSTVPGLIIHKARGAFYMSAVFMPARDDKKFVYDLLESTGVCVVPLSSGFNSRLTGFRFTLLEPNQATFEKTIATLKAAASVREHI
ncbi:MAG: pyridoxal phosphate-dependent aminotransferase [Candidatus Pacebacteria bacterium]|nr:pyridoxal phosphate-dependent aminotransferase [Candidatus Paceibacterota bacterium]